MVRPRSQLADFCMQRKISTMGFLFGKSRKNQEPRENPSQEGSNEETMRKIEGRKWEDLAMAEGSLVVAMAESKHQAERMRWGRRCLLGGL